MIVAEIREATTTIRKAMLQIVELSETASQPQNFNQMTRWVNTKEEHAKKIITTVSEYCLCQRVKPFGATGSPFTSHQDYVDALLAHHEVMTHAMKTKQTVDTAQADALEHAVDDFAKMYLPLEEDEALADDDDHSSHSHSHDGL
eukprot:CAMPEP_0185766130 /NCGR_PEP_ID=MMETSP1174-20130828/35705_1 /TAXON_ID=35687 /ORGANISM="Dictyocha speculum, Strain CCMP1381" /LENGTH=144 /DNA_ID=CAMNT_0028449649 /DNA_START=80 /DNA_END=514 /DNA_ORIENTATION=-